MDRSNISRRNILCEMSRACLLSHILPIAIFTVLLASLSFVTTSCTSDQTPPFQAVSKSSAQAGVAANETTAQIAAHLSGAWDCSKESSNCIFQTLTFSADLTHLNIQNFYHYCLISTDFDLIVEPEKDGITYFSIRAPQVGELIGPSKSNTNCQQMVAAMKPWDENYSFTHSENWNQITIDEATFERAQTVTPSTNSSPAPFSIPSVSPEVFPPLPSGGSKPLSGAPTV